MTGPTTSKAKRRRIIESDEDDDMPAQTSTSKTSTIPFASGKATTSKTIPSAKKQRATRAVENNDGEVSEAESATSNGVQSDHAASEPIEKEAEEDEEGESELEDEDEKETSAVAAKLAKRQALPDVELKGIVWKTGDPIPYAALSHAFSLIEATTKRLEITALLTAFLLLAIKRRKPGDSESVKQAVYLCINRVCICFCLDLIV